MRLPLPSMPSIAMNFPRAVIFSVTADPKRPKASLTAETLRCNAARARIQIQT